MELYTIKRVLGIALLSMVSLCGFAQDQIARQAPSDRRMKDLNAIKLKGIEAVIPADLENPASDIYTDWNNMGVASAFASI